MVNKEDIPRCKACSNAAPSIEKGFSICHLKHLKVWNDSVVCSDYDNSEIY